ncbi:hypothetical protein ATO7_10627 [Oceanococcus atlanticus]|uniref:Sulfotransferase n=1 Tax=Oceanococcus atlanticus TaxID=1317117 RepID=A0A1Y1SEW8_9GAMM|nr:hypothetical protein [Oceanococcus atlanticus]ORE87491.1 hypothetical protein ATO7_10627 [Oceanococcus atlanticus]
MSASPILVVAGLRNSSVGRVAALLAQHEDALLLPELNLCMADSVGAWLLMAERSQDDIGHGLLRAVAVLQRGRESTTDIAHARDWLWRRSDRSSLSVLEELRQLVSPKRLVIPDLNLGWRPNYMHALSQFQAFQLLHLVRHPLTHCRDITHSLSQDYFVAPEWRDFCDNPSGVIDPQIAWYRIHRNLIDQFGADHARYQRLRLEDLLTALATQRDRLWSDLGWPAQSPSPSPAAVASGFLSPGCEAAVGGMEADVMHTPQLTQELRRDPPLDGLADWRPDGRRLSSEVRQLALKLGYNTQAQV